MTKVSVKKADDYNADTLYKAVCAHFEALGVANEISPDMNVLLKPNMLLGSDPAKAATSHPAFLRAIARRLRELGVKTIVLADSSGGLYNERMLRKTYDACGFSSLSDILTLNFDTSSRKENGFQIIKPVLDADYIINCAKLKTHALMLMTAAVKNMFGSVPGLKKAEYHCTRATIEPFTKLIVDLHETVKPQLNLVDAIDCMEGNGPSGGSLRHMGYTFASKNAYAADEVCAKLMHITPIMVRTIQLARKRGLVDTKLIELIGDPVVPADPAFKLPDSYKDASRSRFGGGIGSLLWGRASTRPVVVTEKCIGCGKCAEGCPKHIITISDKKAFIPRKGCISCFCCHELCPEKAIDIIKR